MKNLNLLLTFAFLSALPGTVSRCDGQVETELVGAVASIQPGRPFTVALRMAHQPGWHTYWVNPGTGLATSLSWTLPEGFKTGPIQWPTPLTGLKFSSHPEC